MSKINLQNAKETGESFTDWMNEAFYGTWMTNDQWCHPFQLEDGLNISIQASANKYCSPKQNCSTQNFNYYTQFEVMVYNGIIEEFEKYLEFSNDDGSALYVYVPAAVIQRTIDLRGGISWIIEGAVTSD